MTRQASRLGTTLLLPQADWEVLGRSAIRFFFEKLPLAALVILVAIVIRAAYLQPSHSPFSAAEVKKLKALAERQVNQNGLPQDTPPGQLSADEIVKLKSLAARSPSSGAQFDETDTQALKSLAANSKELLGGKLDSDEIDKLKEDVKRYLEWVIAIAGIFSIAQTIAAAYASQSFARQAERDVAELEEFKKDYEVLARAGQAQKTAFGILEDYRGKDGWIDWRAELYGQMSVVNRQLVLAADRYLGYELGHDLTMPQTPSSQESGVLRMLANFYVSKYDHENKLGFAQWQDLERAQHLLQLWIKIDRRAFQLHNDLAMVFIHYAGFFDDREKAARQAGNQDAAQRAAASARDAREQADKALKDSEKLGPNHQRTYYGQATIAHDLAIIAGDAQNRVAGLKNAVQLVGKAISHQNWETEPRPRMVTDMLYNSACYAALLASSPDSHGQISVSAQDARSVITLLTQVAAKGTERKKFVDFDFDDPQGDLYEFRVHLAQDQRDALDNLRPDLSRHPPDESLVLS